MKSVYLLDCTLRDGGYVNDWKFGHSVTTGIYKRLDAAGADFIEVGFLDERRPFDIDRTIVPGTKYIDEIFKGVQKKSAVPVAMIDFGTCSISKIDDCKNTFIDGIRVIFKKDKIEQALPYCELLKEKGYKLFIQVVSITAYSDKELLAYVEKINELKPYAFSIVDTYGLLDHRKLFHYFDLIDSNLNDEIIIGYHGHNNFQLAFSNTIEFLSFRTKHCLIVDSTVYGMGKSAGNCPSELISLHMNQHYGKEYDIDQILEALDTDLLSVYQQHYWGYRYNFFVSAMQNCHPEYVQYLLDKKTLTVSAINEILAKIPDEKRLLYDRDYIESTYLIYQSNAVDDNADIKRLKTAFAKKRLIVLLGPGRSCFDEKYRIQSYIEEKKAMVIAINFKPEGYICDYIFVSNAKRYSKLADSNMTEDDWRKLIITSNITPFDAKPEYILNYQSLLQGENRENDNALLLCLSVLCKLRVNKVILAGFDGFSKANMDYYNVSYSFAGNEDYREKNNEKTIKGLRKLSKKITIEFLTKSLYQEEL